MQWLHNASGSFKTGKDSELYSIRFINICCALQTPPIDYTIYRSMLRAIRRVEQRRGALASYAFIAQERDLLDLIDKIWHGHSLLSQNSIHAELRYDMAIEQYIFKNIINSNTIERKIISILIIAGCRVGNLATTGPRGIASASQTRNHVRTLKFPSWRTCTMTTWLRTLNWSINAQDIISKRCTEATGNLSNRWNGGVLV